MADYAIHDTTLIGTSNVIRKKEGSSALIDPADYPKRINLMGMLEEKTISGAVASCADGADAVPLSSWTIDVNPTLAGKSQIIATQFQGINFFNEDWEVGGINDTTGLPNSDTNKIRSKTFSRIRGGVTIYIKTPQPIRVLFYEADETFISETANIRNNTFVVPSNASLFKIRGTVDYGTTYNDDISINYPSTDTDYHAYVSAPVDNTVNLGQTIYGGQADVVNGTGKTKVYKQTYTGDNVGTVSITYGQADEGYTHLWFNIAGIPLAYNPTSDNVISNITLPWNNNASAAGIPAVGECWRLINGGSPQKPIIYMYIHQTWANVSAFKTWLNANPITVVYEVEDETDFTFTPITPTPETYLNSNCFWGDTGDSEVVYRSSGTVTPIVPVLTTKSITENGTYDAEDDDADGYSQVTVNVPEDTNVIFKNGQFHRTADMEIKLNTGASIGADGYITTGVNQWGGMVVKSYTLNRPYILVFKVTAVTGSTRYQTGRCNQNADIQAMLSQGTGRLSYNDTSISAGNSLTLSVQVTNGTDGVYIGCADTAETKIEEIYLFDNPNAVKSCNN